MITLITKLPIVSGAFNQKLEMVNSTQFTGLSFSESLTEQNWVNKSFESLESVSRP